MGKSRCHAGRELTGPAGKAIEVIHDEHATIDQTATVATWLLHCPGQSPAWSDYLLCIIHLRPIEGVRPAVITVPHATHEVMLFALDPQPKPVPNNPKSWIPLRPFNVVEQIELPDDEAAAELLFMATKAVLANVLPAEPLLSGAREPWRTALIKTSAHLRGEEHAP